VLRSVSRVARLELVRVVRFDVAVEVVDRLVVEVDEVEEAETDWLELESNALEISCNAVFRSVKP